MQLEPFYLNEWKVYPSLNRACYGSRTVHLEPKIIDVLVYLAQRAGTVVSRNEMMNEIWPDTIVLSDSLNRCISQIRSTFESDGNGGTIIETIRKRGYRLVADVRYVDMPEEMRNEVTSLPVLSGSRLTNVSFSLASSAISSWYHYTSPSTYIEV